MISSKFFSFVAFVAVHSSFVDADWVMGDTGKTCNQVCGDRDQECNVEEMNKLTSTEKVGAAFESAGYTCRSFHAPRDYPGTPFSTGRTNDDCAPLLPNSSVTCSGNIYGHHSVLCFCGSMNPGAQGDPHIKTWVGENFDFHGVCDLVLLSNQEFDFGSGMFIHIRNKHMRSWPYISTAAVSIDEDILQITGGKDSSIYYLNGKKQDPMNNIDGVVGELSGYKLKYQQISKKSVKYEIVLGTTESIVLETWNKFVSVSIKNPVKLHFGGSLGLMGKFPSGAKLARDNTTIVNDSNIFGQEWQVKGSEQSLFTETEGPQFPTECDIPSSIEMRRRLANSIVTIEIAKAACTEVAKYDKDLCLFDVLATNDIGSAGVY